jgi:endoglucanase
MRLGRWLLASALLSALLTGTLGCGPGADPEPANPLAGSVLWVDPESAAALAEQQLRSDGDPTTADGLTAISSQPVATWLVNDDPVPLTQRVTQTAAVTGQLPVLVLYHRPGRDCGSSSGGGAGEQSSYLAWVGAVADAIGDQRALVVVEPDAIPQALSGQCAQDGNPATTYAMLASAVDILARHENTLVYLDAGHPGWIADTEALAGALRDSGAEQSDGFSLNVSNFATTADNQAYGDDLSAALGGKQYVVDVSRNGRGAPQADPASIDAWCNPPGVALGENPRIGADRARSVAYLWVKEPGASDGNCRDGEPPAGQFWPEYALRLVQQRP